MLNKSEISKDDWKIIIANDLKNYGDDYDTLTILSVISSKVSKKFTYSFGKPIWLVNYKTTKGNWSTGFGTMEYRKEEMINILRNAKIKIILD